MQLYDTQCNALMAKYPVFNRHSSSKFQEARSSTRLGVRTLCEPRCAPIFTCEIGMTLVAASRLLNLVSALEYDSLILLLVDFGVNLIVCQR
jgi:hypothetical protein